MPKQDKVRILQSYLEGALASCAEQDEEATPWRLQSPYVTYNPVCGACKAFPLESHDEGEIDFQVGEPFEPQVEDADIEAEVAEQQSRLEEDRRAAFVCQMLQRSQFFLFKKGASALRPNGSWKLSQLLCGSVGRDVEFSGRPVFWSEQSSVCTCVSGPGSCRGGR
eukprot:2292657-Amphidinium_carterae.1